ncbi:MAG TPA: DHH family phosphoesterase [bacterium]|nr:DHH family phosphoesterase [bacterium]
MIHHSKQLANVLKNIRESRSILLLTHQDPDADAIGSTRAMAMLLTLLRKKVQTVYVFQKTKPPRSRILSSRRIQVLRRTSTSPKPTIDLSAYDYALVLDTSYSDHNILGCKFELAPRLGVGTIDHHTRSDSSFFPEQDYNVTDAAATCEIIYTLIPEFLNAGTGKNTSDPAKLLAHFTPLQAQKIARALLPGILDDMVGLTVYEKINSQVLDILVSLKKTAGTDFFFRELRKTRTILFSGEIEPLTRYLSHQFARDRAGTKYELYFLELPGKFSAYMRKNSSAIVTLFEHYARTSCEKHGLHYGMFIMTVDKFDPRYIKFSARGPLIKPLFKINPLGHNLFLSFGISGNSAMGGRIAPAQKYTFKADFLSLITQSAKRRTIPLNGLDPHLKRRLHRLVRPSGQSKKAAE